MNPQSGRQPAGRSRTIARDVFAIEELQLVLPDPIALDTSFALLPSTQLTIYTDHSRLASCRKKRPR